MVSPTTLTIILGYAAAFWCLDALSEAIKILTSGTFGGRSASASFPRLAVAALLPAVLLASFSLTSLLLFAYVRVLAVADGAAQRRRLLDRLANVALAATAAALLAGTVLRLGADGYLVGADDFSTE